MHRSSGARLVPALKSWKYRDPDYQQRELQQIFSRTWIYAAHESQLPEPGSYLTLDIGDNPLLLIRGPDGVVRGFYNVCIHRGHLVASGTGCAAQLTCPYHAWVYDQCGALRRARAVAPEQLREHKGLRSIEVETWHGFVFVRLAPGGPGLHDMFSAAFADLAHYLPDIDRLRHVKRYVHDVRGNWKVLVDNYLECYHCAPCHPSFVDLMKVRDYDIRTFGFHSTHRAPAGRPDNTAYQFRGDGAAHPGFDGWWLWPNLTFNIFPGTRNLLLFHMLPVTADTSIGYCDYFFVDGQVDDQARALMDWETHVLSEEDNARVASVHRGLRSQALDAGVLLVEPERGDITEHAIRHFHDLVDAAVDVAAEDVSGPGAPSASERGG